MSKNTFVDGYWTRETHYGKQKIKLTTWRNPDAWITEAEYEYGKVTVGGDTALDSAKSALLNLRLNIPIWNENAKMKFESYINPQRSNCYIN